MILKYLTIVMFLVTEINSELVEIVTPESTNNATEPTTTTPKVIKPKVDSYLEALKISQRAKKRVDHEHHGYLPVEPTYSHDFPTYGPPTPVDHFYQSPLKPSPYGMQMDSSPHLPLANVLPLILPKSIDLQTVFKLILKLVLFKMIVKFIAVVCLLLVWPLFNKKSNDEERQMEALGELTEFVWSSIFPQQPGNMEAPEAEAENIVEKVAGQIDEKMTVPSEEAAIGFLEFCVSAANAVVGWMMGFLRRRRNEADPLEETLWTGWEKAKTIILRIVKS